MAATTAVITSPLSGRTVVRVPYVADMRERLRGCGAEPFWEADSEVWTMPRRTVRSVAATLESIFVNVRVDVEFTFGQWRSFGPQDQIPRLA